MTSIKESNNQLVPEDTRGKWSSGIDFVMANIAYSLSVNFAIWIFYINSGNVNLIFLLVNYLHGLIVFSIPIFFVQFFIGQFSSSGFISAYRIVPLFKGIGYVILLLNILSITYMAAVTGVSFIFFSYSITSKWPACNFNFNSSNCINAGYVDDWLCTFGSSDCEPTKPIETFTNLFISWRVISSTYLVWILIGSIVLNRVHIMGKIIRVLTIITILILITIAIRFMCIDGAWNSIANLLKSSLEIAPYNSEIDYNTWYIGTFSLGAGMGITLTLASFNNFQTNIGKLSLITITMHIILFLTTGLIIIIGHDYLKNELQLQLYESVKNNLNEVHFFFGMLFQYFPVSNLWLMLFSFMIFSCNLLGCVVQMFSILTALFDEFVSLRHYKMEFSALLSTIMCVLSLIYCVYEGFFFISQIIYGVLTIQLLISAIELGIVCWIYGSSRFQRDLRFMNGKKLPKFLIYIIGILSPLGILAFYIREYIISSVYYIVIVENIAKVLIILIIPIYMSYKLLISTGNLRQRFINLCKPENWLPDQADDQTEYKEFIDNNVTFDRI